MSSKSARRRESKFAAELKKAEREAQGQAIEEQVQKYPYRLMVGIPSHDIVPMAFAHDLAMMAAVTSAAGATYGIQYRQSVLYGTLIDSMRNSLCKVALENDATHLLFIDSDMRIPNDLALRLLARKESIVGVNYCTRRLPAQPTAFRHIGGVVKDDDGNEVIVPHDFLWPEYEEGAPDLVDVESMGFGGVMIDTSVLRQIPQPWFRTLWVPGPGGEPVSLGEDVYFCAKARKHGLQPKIDRTFDGQIGHCGSMVYNLVDAYHHSERSPLNRPEPEETPSLIITSPE